MAESDSEETLIATATVQRLPELLLKNFSLHQIYCTISPWHRPSMKRLWQALGHDPSSALIPCDIESQLAKVLDLNNSNNADKGDVASDNSFLQFIAPSNIAIKHSPSADLIVQWGQYHVYFMSADRLSQRKNDAFDSAVNALVIRPPSNQRSELRRDSSTGELFTHSISLPISELRAVSYASKMENATVQVDVYNITDSSTPRCTLWLSSNDRSALIETYNRLVCDLIPSQQVRSSPAVMGMPQLCFDRPGEWATEVERIHREIQSADPDLYRILDQSMLTIQQALEKYGPQRLAFSFNGGKDCTVLMFIFTFMLIKHFMELADKEQESAEWWPRRVKTVYISPKNSFQQVEQFARDTAARFNLNLVCIPGPIKSGLESFIQQNPEVKAILVGTRRTDPFAQHIQHFSPTDPGWPQFMRVNPVIDWEYSHIWRYTEYLHIPHCTLYDRGYTSIGSRNNTLPNPALICEESPCGYRQAKYLKDGSLERQGRFSNLP